MLDGTSERIKGAYQASDFTEILLHEWEVGIAPGVSTGFYNLTGLYMVKKKQWTVVTGTPGSGKSTFVDNIMVNLAHKENWKFLVCSPENQPVHRHIETLLEIYTGKKYNNPARDYTPEHCMNARQLAEGLKWVNEHFYFICPDETEFNIDYILEMASEIKRDLFRFDGMTLDPYNELEHKQPNGMREDQYVSALLSKVRRWCRAEDLHFWFVAHPTKQRAVQVELKEKSELKSRKLYQRTSLYDISGGAHWYNKCDNGIVVYRNEHEDIETTTVAIDKIRFKECGKKGDAEFVFSHIDNRLIPR